MPLVKGAKAKTKKGFSENIKREIAIMVLSLWNRRKFSQLFGKFHTKLRQRMQ